MSYRLLESKFISLSTLGFIVTMWSRTGFSDKFSTNLFININQLNALNFIISLFHASTCFEHMCSSSGGQNCIVQSLVSSHL